MRCPACVALALLLLTTACGGARTITTGADLLAALTPTLPGAAAQARHGIRA